MIKYVFHLTNMMDQKYYLIKEEIPTNNQREEEKNNKPNPALSS